MKWMTVMTATAQRSSREPWVLVFIQVFSEPLNPSKHFFLLMTSTDGDAPQMLNQIWFGSFWGQVEAFSSLPFFVCVWGGLYPQHGPDVPCGCLFDLSTCLGRWVGSGDSQMIVRRVSQRLSGFNVVAEVAQYCNKGTLPCFSIFFKIQRYDLKTRAVALLQKLKTIQWASSLTPCHVTAWLRLDLKYFWDRRTDLWSVMRAAYRPQFVLACYSAAEI